MQISHRNATERIAKWINLRRFAPNAFKQRLARSACSFGSIYLPYSLCTATTTRYTGQRGVHRTEFYTDSEGKQQSRIVNRLVPGLRCGQ